jgi:hypothetical protein
LQSAIDEITKIARRHYIMRLAWLLSVARNRLVLYIVVAVVGLGLIAALVSRSRVLVARQAALPALTEIEKIEISLWGEQIGRKNLMHCSVRRGDFSTILRCLSPSEFSEDSGKMMIFPPLGVIHILLKDGRDRQVVFVEAGKNALCFTLDGVPYLRGGKLYRHYEEDHRNLFGLPYEHLDEAICVVDKLLELGGCNAP